MLRLNASVATVAGPEVIGRRLFLRTTGLLALGTGAVAMIGCGGDADVLAPDIDDPGAGDLPSGDAGASDDPGPVDDGDVGDVDPPVDEKPDGVEVEMSADLEQIGGTQEVRDRNTLAALDTDNANGGDDPLILVRVDADTVAANTFTCTHQQCDVEYDGADGFDCPCHGSRFRLDGSVQQGPAGRPLLNYAATIHEGSVFLVKA